MNGIVNVKAKDLDTQQEQAITITGSNGLSKEDIDRMVREAEENAEADAKRKEETEVKNKAESLINDIDVSLQEKGDSMKPEEKEKTQQLRDELKTALDNNDIETLKKRIEELEKAYEFMRNYQGQQGAADAGKPGENPDDVVDADYSDKNKA